MDVTKKLNTISDSDCKKSLVKLIDKYLNPAFGSLPKREIDLLLFEILEDLKIIKDKPELYQLVSDLKVTRSKARSLLYDRELRKYKETELDTLVKEALVNPIISKDGEEFKLEIESPLVSDHLRAKVKNLGFLSDGSFSPSIVKLPLNAVTAIIESYLTEQEKKKIKKVLIRAGVPDSSFGGIIKAVIKKAASKFASEAGEALVDQAKDYLSPILSGTVEVIEAKVKTLFTDDNINGENAS